MPRGLSGRLGRGRGATSAAVRGLAGVLTVGTAALLAVSFRADAPLYSVVATAAVGGGSLHEDQARPIVVRIVTPLTPLAGDLVTVDGEVVNDAAEVAYFTVLPAVGSVGDIRDPGAAPHRHPTTTRFTSMSRVPLQPNERRAFTVLLEVEAASLARIEIGATASIRKSSGAVTRHTSDFTSIGPVGEPTGADALIRQLGDIPIAARAVAIALMLSLAWRLAIGRGTLEPGRLALLSGLSAVLILFVANLVPAIVLSHALSSWSMALLMVAWCVIPVAMLGLLASVTSLAWAVVVAIPAYVQLSLDVVGDWDPFVPISVPLLLACAAFLAAYGASRWAQGQRHVASPVVSLGISIALGTALSQLV